jgi:cobalt/nickel transport system permease protein
MPNIFAVQMLMLYRYIFVLVEEGQRMHRARALRTFGRGRIDMKTFAHLVGQLLLRTIDRGQRIHLAMLCRGFDGTIRIRQQLRITGRDIGTLLLSAVVLIAMRQFNLALLLGQLLTDSLP